MDFPFVIQRLLILTFFLQSPLLIAHSPLMKHQEIENEGFIQKPFFKFLGKEFPASLSEAFPLSITVPSDFRVEKKSQQSMTVVYVGKAFNADALASGRGIEGVGEGVFAISISTRVAFHVGTNKFSGEGDSAQRAAMERSGMMNIVERRVDANGIPIFELTCRNSNGRMIYLAYIALMNSGSVMKITYLHPKEHRPRDLEIWSRFIAGLGKR